MQLYMSYMLAAVQTPIKSSNTAAEPEQAERRHTGTFNYPPDRPKCVGSD